MIDKIFTFVSANWLNLLILFVAFLTLVFTYFLWRKTRKEELSRLRSLLQQLDYIKKISKDQFDYLKTKGIPSWTTTNIDLNFYLTHIDYKIKGEGFFRFKKIPTAALKEKLMNVSGKINNINNLFSLIYNSHVSNTKESKQRLKEYKKELTRENHYYSDLDKMIDAAKMEIKKIIKKVSIREDKWY